MRVLNINAVKAKVKWLGFAGVLLALAMISGCATNYPMSKEVRDQARQVTFDQVRADPDGTRGAVVVWGGRIINVANEANGSAIYIICLPVTEDEKPVAYGPSPGRFIATTPEFLDPTMIPQNRRITIGGSLDGVRTEKLGNMAYAYPVIRIKEMHVWQPEAGEDYPDYSGYPGYGPGYYYGPNWGWGWGWGWGPAWGWGWGYPYYPYYYGGGFNHGFHGGYHGSSGGGGYYGGFHGNSSGGGGTSAGGGFHGSGGGSSAGGGGGGGFHGGMGGGGHH